MHAAEFIKAIAIVLCVAAVTTVLFQRLKQPVVLGYIIAGLIIGPHLPIPLVADQEIVTTLSELGVILLMFSLGLEFSLRKLLQVGATAGVTALIQSSLMIWLGYVVGRAFGWTTMESIFCGAIIAISSTTIIAKAFDEQGVRGSLREVVVGVLVVEDLIAILLMTTLTAIASGSGLSAGGLAITVGKLALFLVGLVVGGLLLVPRLMRGVVKLGRGETTLVAAVGICFAGALLAHEFGYSVALGAFLAGSLVAESGEEKVIEHLVNPVRDVFAAVFFVSVGMLIDPSVLKEHWLTVVVISVVVIVGKFVGVTLGAFLSGNSPRTSIQAGMSLAQIGEFSFIIAGLGLSLKATGGFLYPIAITVSAITTLTTPWLIRASGPVANLIDRKLPHPLQTFVSLYGSWIEKLRTSSRPATQRTSLWRMVGLLFLDAALLAAVVIATSVKRVELGAWLVEHLSLGERLARFAVLAGAAAVAAPFCFGVMQLAKRLGTALADRAMPPKRGLDLAAAPRRALVMTLRLACLLLVGVPLVAVTQPFLPNFGGALLFLLLVVGFGLVFWRSATNLDGHVRAGSQAIVDSLAAQSHSGEGHAAEPNLDDVRSMFHGMGEPVPVKLPASSPAVGKTLAQLNLRGLTGATVLAIRRAAGEAGTVVPTAHEVLHGGDVLALAGSNDAIAAARALLA